MLVVSIVFMVGFVVNCSDVMLVKGKTISNRMEMVKDLTEISSGDD